MTSAKPFHQDPVILIIEDARGTAHAQKDALAGLNHRVIVAGEHEAPARIRSGAVTLVILSDVLSENTSGLEFFRTMKRAGDDTPVVLVTEFTSEEAIIEALREGIRDFVPRSDAYLQYLPDAVARVLGQIKLEEDLLHYRLRLWSLFDSTPDGVITVEADQVISSLNPAAEQIFQREGSSTVGKPLIDLLPDGLPEWEAARPTRAGADASSRSLRTYASGLRSDGARLDLELSVVFVELEGAAITTLIVRDITDKLRNDRRSAAQHEIMRLLAESTSVTDIAPVILRILVEEIGWQAGFIWKLDSVAELLRCVEIWHVEDERLAAFAAQNRRLTFPCGIDQLGKAWSESKPQLNLAAPDDPGALRRALLEAAQLSAVFCVPIVQDDEIRGVIEFLGRAERAPDASFLSLLESLAIPLGQVIERRQVEEQLLQTQKLEAVGRLAGGIAHDFNNLLTVITGHTALLLGETRPDDPNREALSEVLASAGQAATLTKQLLGFSRKQMLRLTTLNLESIVVEQRSALERNLGPDIELIMRFQPDVGWIRGDASQIEQILDHLATNARDAMPNGGTLTIDLCDALLDEAHAREIVGAAPGNYVMLGVSDTGRGMDARTLRRIFEPYFTTKPLGRGTGLGLATVYGLMKQTGGHIWVYSEPGKGTVFKTYFPRAEGAAVPAPSVAKAEPGDLHGSETILVVEDEARIRTFVSRLLKKHGYEVLEAENGSAALKLFQQHQSSVDLVLSDVVMPVMDGLKLRSALRGLDPNVCVVLMSGYMEETVVPAGLIQPGVFVSKPFSAMDLLAKIRSALDGHEKTRERVVDRRR